MARAALASIRASMDGASRSLTAQARGVPNALEAQGQGALQQSLATIRAAIARLHPEALATAALCSCGAVGLRCYAPGQRLMVRSADGAWCDAEVLAAESPDGGHRLRLEGRGEEAPTLLSLHPWNHAPHEL